MDTEDAIVLFGLISWVIAAAAIGGYAERKGRSWVLYFLASIFLSPLIGLLAAWAAAPNHERAAKRAGLKKCPDCAEWVQPNARKCRFCGHAFNAPSDTNIGLFRSLR